MISTSWSYLPYLSVGTNTLTSIIPIYMFPWVLSNKTTDVRINYIFIPDAPCILYVATIYGVMGCSLGRVSFLCRPKLSATDLCRNGCKTCEARPVWLVNMISTFHSKIVYVFKIIMKDVVLSNTYVHDSDHCYSILLYWFIYYFRQFRNIGLFVSLGRVLF